MIGSRIAPVFHFLLVASIAVAGCGRLKPPSTDGGDGGNEDRPSESADTHNDVTVDISAHEAAPYMLTEVKSEQAARVDGGDGGQDADAGPDADSGTDLHPDMEEPHDGSDGAPDIVVDDAGDTAGEGGGDAADEGPEDAAPNATDAAAEGGSCTLPMKVCGGTCIDPRTDNLNCGFCGNDCGAFSVCTNGLCL